MKKPPFSDFIIRQCREAEAAADGGWTSLCELESNDVGVPLRALNQPYTPIDEGTCSRSRRVTTSHPGGLDGAPQVTPVDCDLPLFELASLEHSLSCGCIKARSSSLEQSLDNEVWSRSSDSFSSCVESAFGFVKRFGIVGRETTRPMYSSNVQHHSLHEEFVA